jgi:hypothetical protein
MSSAWPVFAASLNARAAVAASSARRQNRLKSMPAARSARMDETSEKLSARVRAAFRPMMTSA